MEISTKCGGKKFDFESQMSELALWSKSIEMPQELK